MPKRWGTVSGLVLVISVLLLGYQNCEFLGEGMEVSSSYEEWARKDPGGSTAQAFFESDLKPFLQQHCHTCHLTFSTAPKDILDYQKTRARLSPQSLAESPLYQFIDGTNFHTGSVFCGSGAPQKEALCSELGRWWEMEFPDPMDPADPTDPADPDAPVQSAITGISDMGVISGYALNPNDSQEIMEVFFFVGGPAGTGVRAGSTLANVELVGSNYSGHRFQYQMDEQFRNGEQQILFAYVKSEIPENLINANGSEFTSYSFSVAGRDYFNANLAQPFTTSCNECHFNERNDYELTFQLLLTPPPSEGGTATNNEIIKRITEQVEHQGGNFCEGGVDTAPCSLVQEWWRTEFE